MPIFSCSQCQTKLNAPDTASGKKVKCRCGALVDVPAGPTTSSPAKAQAAKPQAKASSPTNNMGQLLDQLTASDFSRAEKKVESTGPSQKQKDTQALDVFKDPASKSKKRGAFNGGSGRSSSGSMEDLNAIATIYFVFGGLHLAGLIMGIIAAVLNSGVMSIAAIALLLLISIPTAGYDVLAGIGLKKRQPWGWWLGAIGIGWVAGSTLPGALGNILTQFAIGQGKLDASKGVSSFVNGTIFIAIFFGAILMLRQMIQKEIMKKYNVQVAPALAWFLCLFGGLLLGIAYMVFMLVFVFRLISLGTST